MAEEYTDKQLLAGLQQLSLILQGAKYIDAAIKRHAQIERELKGFDAKKAALQKELDDVAARKLEYEEKERGARLKHNAAMAQMDEQARAREAELGRLDRDIKAAKDVITGLAAEYEEKKKAKDAELAKEQSALDKIRAEIERVKKQVFAA